MKRIFKRLIFNFYLISKVSWVNLFLLYKRNSKNIVLISTPFPHHIFSWMTSGTFENDFALLQSIIELKKDFRIVLGAKALYRTKNSVVYHNLSKYYGFYEGKNYSESLINFQKLLLLNNNIIFPSFDSSLYWENKVFMHEMFTKLNISSPKTYLVSKFNDYPQGELLNFPVLFKPAHASGSTGIVKLNTIEEYYQIVKSTSHTEYLIQEWIDMRRDLRLIYIGNDLVLHYWRINQDKEWKPTSTGHGSNVDFEMLPSQWMDFIFDEYKKLNIATGAFDITWRNDDLSTKPLILEVSPSYMPNPVPSGEFKNKSYSEFKKNIWGQDAYYKKYIDLVFDLKKKLIKEYDKY